MPRKIRVLVGKPGLDGHDRGAKVVAAALRDAGMEVIYTGLHQTPEQIVEAAVQEDVDVVALSILSGAHMTLFPEVLKLMRACGIDDKLLTGGGIIAPEDTLALAKMGVGRLFGPGASTQDIAQYIRDWFVERHGVEAMEPVPEPVAATASSANDASSPLRGANGGRRAAAGRRAKAARPKAAAGRQSRTKPKSGAARGSGKAARSSSKVASPGARPASAPRKRARAGSASRSRRTAGRRH